ncbi:MAG: hypothetical protein HQK50_12275 [Oligoflexia bacterium]|nr:hypothetical protein [Oligoflexia bacterium]MBF0366342.1 hypothetical protein [Oligoflexia bacterium]
MMNKVDKIKTVRLGSLLVLFFLFAFTGSSFAAELQNKLSVDSIAISPKYINLKYGKFYVSSNEEECSVFKGTFAGNSVTFKAQAAGGQGAYEHTLVYLINESYDTKEFKTYQVTNRGRRGGDTTFTIQLPFLKESVPFVNQVVTLITKDSKGKAVSTDLKFTVSRPVVLTHSRPELSAKADCYQRYPAYKSVASVLSNGSTNISNVEIIQGIQRLWSNRDGRRWGVHFTPTVFTAGVGLSLFGVNYEHFRETSKQTVETVEVRTTYNLNPGDFLQIYTQPTRYVTAYDATLVSPCGERETIEAAYMFQWWGFSYHVFHVDPYDTMEPDVNTIGAPIRNTCSSEYEDIVSRMDGDNFVSTNN